MATVLPGAIWAAAVAASTTRALSGALRIRSSDIGALRRHGDVIISRGMPVAVREGGLRRKTLRFDSAPLAGTCMRIAGPAARPRGSTRILRVLPPPAADA